ncbi:hypothetical protein [Microbacterium trichothecenolyticum]|uniref:hypothetical protein n=1 Tax=Microbacterium trichothecenolyticum TaxID=69370 RepID=UPI0021D691E4|nr:hypothetical protein [Microbacterium trichothecenolyticum]
MSVSKRRPARLTAVALVIAVGVGTGAAAGVGDDSAAADSADDYRAQYHFTVPDHWKNDPQRPIFVDGKFHYYYLYNSDYNADPTANFGTEWRLATSYDGVVSPIRGSPRRRRPMRTTTCGRGRPWSMRRTPRASVPAPW